ncbi:MAG: hypothetical protein WA110_05685 [Anaerolineaceae bacterium]
MSRFSIRVQKALRILRDEGIQSLYQRMAGKYSVMDKYSDNLPANIDGSKSPPIIFVGKKLSAAQLREALINKMPHEAYTIVLSQDDYLNNVGGVQLKIADEQAAANQKGGSYLHIHPYAARQTLVFEDHPVLGVNLNGERIGFVDQNALIEVMEGLTTKRVSTVSIHHTMGFNLDFVQWLIKAANTEQVFFWLHDFFSLCPSYFLLRNNIAYCGAPDISSNACQICAYGALREKQQQAFTTLFQNNRIEIVAPSEFTLSLWKEKFPVKGVPGKVRPHAALVWKESSPRQISGSPLRIAFVGFPVFHKGWNTWLRLTKQLRDDPRFEFYLFSSMRRASRNYKQITVAVTKQDRSKMSRVLRDNHIDVAFLWSICPETFSFTLYESLAAGCYVLTCRDSGNIQYYLREHPVQGQVVESEKALFELFSGGGIVEQVETYQKDGLPQAEIFINNAE